MAMPQIAMVQALAYALALLGATGTDISLRSSAAGPQDGVLSTEALDTQRHRIASRWTKPAAANSVHAKARSTAAATGSELQLGQGSKEEWGNHDALTSCFGEHYKKEGTHEYIGHCFHEHDTHNTCCMLDQQARDQNDANGNPIGQRSLDLYLLLHPEAKENGTDTSQLLTPWCTCFFSQVCSFYANTTDTKVKFVNDCGCSQGKPGLGFCLGQIPQDEVYQCEGWARESFRAPSHTTPGVKLPPNGLRCPKLEGKGEVNVTKCELGGEEHPDAEQCEAVCGHVGRPVKKDMAGKSGGVAACCEEAVAWGGSAEIRFSIAQDGLRASDITGEQTTRMKVNLKQALNNFLGKEKLEGAKISFELTDSRAGNGHILGVLKLHFHGPKPPELKSIPGEKVLQAVQKVLPNATVERAANAEESAAQARHSNNALLLVVLVQLSLAALLGAVDTEA